MPAAPAMTVVPRSALAFDADGPQRGYAHIGFDDYPADAPGHLRFDPLLLFGVGDMHPGEGFAMHHHEGIENLLLVLEGGLRHSDAEGNAWVSGPGDLALMSAGSGGDHAEWVEGDRPVKALVFWLRSDDGAPCVYHRRNVARALDGERWTLVASGDPSRAADVMPLRTDAAIKLASLREGSRLEHHLPVGRRAYLMAVDGQFGVNGESVDDGARVLATGPQTLVLASGRAASTRVILIDMPAPSLP